MRQEIQVLQSISRQTGKSIRSIDRLRKDTSDAELLQVLALQREEYARIRQVADRLLLERGLREKQSYRLADYTQGLLRGLQIRSDATPDARIARLRLRESSYALENSVHSLSDLQLTDPKVASLSRQLLLTQQAEMGRMQQFL